MATCFVAVENQMHFHPDRRWDGFGVLVLQRSSAIRAAGVYLAPCDGGGWRRVADVRSVPNRWTRVRGRCGRFPPVQLRRTRSGEIAVRWLGADGRPVPPSTWDEAGMTPMQRLAASDVG